MASLREFEHMKFLTYGSTAADALREAADWIENNTVGMGGWDYEKDEPGITTVALSLSEYEGHWTVHVYSEEL